MVLLNFCRAYNLSSKYDHFFDEKIIKLCLFDYSKEVCYDSGSVEFEKLHKAFRELYFSLKKETNAFKAGEGNAGGHIRVIFENNKSYKIFINYAKSSGKVLIIVFDDSNFSISRYYDVDTNMVENFLEIYNANLYPKDSTE